MGFVNVVLPRVCRITVEVRPFRAQDAIPNDVVVVCVSKHRFGMMSPNLT